MDELGQVTKWVIDWKWRLTAGNLFSVNNALLPAVSEPLDVKNWKSFELMLIVFAL